MSYDSSRHPINFVAKRTGLSTHVIRVWERRYGAIQPHRSETNRRLYSDAEVDRLKLLSQVKEQGQSIRLIAQLPDDELRELLTRTSNAEDVVPVSRNNGARRDRMDTLTESCREAIWAMDFYGLTKALMDGSVQLPLLVLLDDLIGPLMRWVGDRWHAGELRVAHEHMATATTRAFLSRLKETQRAPSGSPRIVISTPAGEDHEVGALMVAVAAASVGWHDLYLGPNLPAQEIALAAMDAKADAVAVSIVYPGNNPTVIQGFCALRNLLEERVPIIAGGGGVRENRPHYNLDGVYCVESLGELQKCLEKLQR
jgi:MerR family transcriptional regulator, light-induced transcriptional regulator